MGYGRAGRSDRVRWLAFALAWRVVGCEPGLGLPRESKDESRMARRPVESAKAVSRGVYWVDEAKSDPAMRSLDGPRLFRGVLSATEVQRAHAATLSATLERRRVVLRAAGEWSWIPEQLLDANSEYTWLGSGGKLERFQTRGDEFGMRRIWPAGPEVGLAAVYCAESSVMDLAQAWVSQLASEFDARTELLTLGHYPACVVALARDTDTATCWHGKLGLGVFEPTWFAVAEQLDAGGLDAAPRDTARQEPAPGDAASANTEQGGAISAPSDCSGGERVAVGCLRVADDRLELEGPDYPTLWLLSGDAEGAVWLGPRGRGVVTGLIPNTDLSLSVRVFADSGVTLSARVLVHTALPEPHIVINEVMANPLGAEPAQEWVELYNDGPVTVDLTGWRFGDAEAERDILEASMQPGTYLLLVNETFSLAAASEIVPDANVPLLRMPLLGKSGLSNTGETLHLSDKFGIVHSRFPSKPKPTAGASVARRAPWDLDDSLMFGEHELPGSSPGSSNRVKLSSD